MGNHPSSNNGNGSNNSGGIRTSRIVNTDINASTTNNSHNNNNGSTGTGSNTVSPSISATSSSSSSHHRPPPQPQSQHQHQSQQPISVGVTTIRNMFHQLQTKHANNNALGLSKAELDVRCKPSGLYSSCHWDDKTIRRLIGDGKLASRQPCNDSTVAELDVEQHECPICFFTYPQMNVTKCCQANICTECYLQLQPYQKPNSSSNNHSTSSGSNSNKPAMNTKTQQNSCPFCNTAKLQVSVAPMKRPQQISEQSSSPLISSVTHNKLQKVAPTTSTKELNEIEPPEMNPNSPPKPGTVTSSAMSSTGFGSSLEQNSRVAMMRARSCSIASEQSHSSGTSTSIKEQQEMVTMIAMTPEERQQIEDEMRAQHLHPLALRIEQEEMERRLKNELQYYSSQQQQQQQQQRQQQSSAQQQQQQQSYHRNASMDHVVPRRNLLNPQNYRTTPPSSFDMEDRANVQANMLIRQQLNQQEQQRPSNMLLSNILFLQNPSTNSIPSGGNSMPMNQSSTRQIPSSSLLVRGLSEEEQIALAIEASLRDTTTTTSTTTTN